MVQRTMRLQLAKKYEVTIFKIVDHGSTLTLSNEGISIATKLFDKKIIRNEKEDKHKLYNVSEKSIVTYTNTYFHSVDSVSNKCSKIPGTSMFTTADKITSISISNAWLLNTKQLFGSDLTLKKLFIHIYHNNHLIHIIYKIRKSRTLE